MATYSGGFDNSGYTLYLDVSESNVSTANNTSTVNWTLRIVSTKALTYGSWDFDGTPYSVKIDGSVVASGSKSYDFRNYQSLTVASGSKTITHNSDGSKSVSCSATFGNSSTPIGDASASGSFTLTKIARYPVIQSATDFTDEGNPSLSFTNPAKIYPLRVKIEAGGNTKLITRDIGTTATSYTFSLTDDERNTLRNLSSSSKTLPVTITVCAMNGENELSASYLGKTMTIINANPAVGAFIYKDSNAFTVAITENNQRIIRENSNLVFTIGTAVALKGATISKYEVTFNSVTKSLTSAGDLDFSFVNLSSNATATLKVTDSRGNTSTKEITVIVDDWLLPTGIISLSRKNNFYSETYLKADGTYSSLNGKNSMTIQYQYKKVTEKNFSELYNLEDNVQTTLDLDNNYQWDIIVIVGDRIGETTYNLFLDRGMPIIFFDRLLNSIGFNCFPTIAETLATSNLIQMYNEKVNVVGQKTLYENESGTTGTVTLIESSANFNYLEIYYLDNNDADFQSVRVANPNNKIVTISCIEGNATPRIYIRASRYTIVGTAITFVRSAFGTIGNAVDTAVTTDQYIKIIKVVGYK